jgi:hypothetical protein
MAWFPSYIDSKKRIFPRRRANPIAPIVVLQEIYHIFLLILCSQIFIGIFLWSSSASSNSVSITLQNLPQLHYFIHSTRRLPHSHNLCWLWLTE